MDKIEKIPIPEDVKRVLDNVSHILIGLNYRETARDYKQAVEKLISLLEAKEPDKSLEEAAENYTDSSEWLIGENLEHIEAAFIAGAKWQASRMPMPEDTVLFQKGVAEGRRLEREDMTKDGNVILAEEDFNAEKEKSMEWGYNLCKEQMLKDAVEGEVYLYHSYNRDAIAILVDIPKENLGDKARIVVLKEEDKK